MCVIGRLSHAERKSVLAAKRGGYIRPMTLDMTGDWPTSMHVKAIGGWLVRDNVGVLRDACGPIHRN